MSGIVLTEVDDATIATPPAGKRTFFADDTLGMAQKDDAGTVTSLTGATGATGPEGPEGPPGAGVPPTVTGDTAVAGAVTHDYGDGPAHETLVDDDLTVTLTGWVAGENIMTIGYTNDGTPGHAVPAFGAEVVNDADLATVWDDSAGAYNLVVLRTVDSGTTVYIVGLPEPASLDATLAASTGEDIADALSGAAAPDAGNVFATMADVVPSAAAFVGCKVYKIAQTVTDNFLAFDVDLWDSHAFHFTSAANLTGTVAKAAASPNIVGTGTSFTTELTVNQVIAIPGTATEIGVVKTITDNTNLVLWQNMVNTATGQTAARRNDVVAIPTGKGGYYDLKSSTWTSAAARLEVWVNGALIHGRGSTSTASGNYAAAVSLLSLAAGNYIQIKGNAGASRAYGDAGSPGDYLVLSLALIGV
jgi:hypothetical protein